MIITGILQVRNEVISGHLARFLEWNLPILDHLVAYDDCSTDQTVSMLENNEAVVIRGDFRSFQSELSIKNSLLTRALSDFPETDWILWLDADELLLESREELESILNESKELGFDGIQLPLVNLWRSEFRFRIDSGFNDLSNVRFWRNNQQLKFKMEPGLHHLMHPAGMKRVRQYSSLRVLHFGFSTDLNILNKFQTYQQAGQRGRNLWRLVDESDLVLEDIFKHSKYLGSRYPKFARSIKEDSYDQISSLLIEKCYFQKNEIHHDKSPIVTLISLIYSGVDWLEFQYGELLKLQNELGQGEVEILFVANDASKEVLDFLKQNLIPYIISPGKKYVDEWYINSVYRAYNFGVELSQGGYVLLTNSDMSYRPGFLIDMLKHRSQNSYLVAKLIESGRLTPAKAAIKKNLGKKLTTFRRRAFYAFSSKMLQEGKSPGGLFMPLLVSRKSFLEAGGYPEGNIHGDSLNNYLRSGVYTLALQGDPLFPGDFAFVKRLEMNDWKHETLTSSIAYHFQEGEKSETRRSARAVIRSGIRMKIENSLLEGKIQCPTINKVSRPRLTIIDSLDKIENKGKYIWLTNDFELFEKIDPRKLRNIQAIITSSALVLKHSAITFNIHAYYVENLMNEKMFDLVRVLEEILALELRNSFLPVEPKPLRLIITEKIPSPLKRVIKSIPVFSR